MLVVYYTVCRCHSHWVERTTVNGSQRLLCTYTTPFRSFSSRNHDPPNAMVGRFSFPLLRDKDSSLVHDHDFSNSQRSLPDASNVLAENTPDLTGIPMATAATRLTSTSMDNGKDVSSLFSVRYVSCGIPRTVSENLPISP